MTYQEAAAEQLRALRGKEKVRILALETSCDETAASVVENGRTIVSNVVFSQIDLHALYGGVVATPPWLLQAMIAWYLGITMSRSIRTAFPAIAIWEVFMVRMEMLRMCSQPPAHLHPLLSSETLYT